MKYIVNDTTILFGQEYVNGLMKTLHKEFPHVTFEKSMDIDFQSRSTTLKIFAYTDCRYYPISLVEEIDYQCIVSILKEVLT